MLATPYYDRLVKVLRDPAMRGSRDAAVYRALAGGLEDPITKRIMFDSRQAAVFDEVDEAPPSNVLPKLHLPFSQFYLEFTEPIKLGEPEPGREDFARAILVISEVAQVKVQSNNTDTVLHLHNITFFFVEKGENSYVDRTFKLHLPTGLAITNKHSALLGTDQSDLPNEWKDGQYFVCGATGRHAGWWERTCLDYASLFCWITCYLMAKSIVIEREPISRQVRRWNERHNIIPRPWHIVKLDPKLISHRAAEETDRHHNYRYDVIGHLRFQHQKIKAGHRDVIEWVRDHQRGLANELYVPKTYVVQAGRRIAIRQMKEYFGDKTTPVS